MNIVIKIRLWICVLFILTAGCKSELDALREQSENHLKNAISVLEKNAGNFNNAEKELSEYIAKNRQNIIEIKTSGQYLLKNLAPEKREEFISKSMEESKILKERIENLVRTYPDGEKLLFIIREIF
jgi:hypothetical protein